MEKYFLFLIFILIGTATSQDTLAEIDAFNENFKPDNIAEVYNTQFSQQSIPERSEFETAEEYKARTDQISEKSDVEYVFKLDTSGLKSWKNYNIDTKQFDFYIPLGKSLAFSIDMKHISTQNICKNEIDDFFEINLSDTRNESKYIGTNMYGVTKEITNTIMENYNISFPLPRELKQYVKFMDDTIFLDIPFRRLEVDDAKKLKENYAIYIAIKIKKLKCLGISTFDYTNESGPTLDNPRDFHWHIHYMISELSEIIIVDTSTRSTIKRLFVKK